MPRVYGPANSAHTINKSQQWSPRYAPGPPITCRRRRRRRRHRRRRSPHRPRRRRRGRRWRWLSPPRRSSSSTNGGPPLQPISAVTAAAAGAGTRARGTPWDVRIGSWRSTASTAQLPTVVETPLKVGQSIAIGRVSSYNVRIHRVRCSGVFANDFPLRP